MSSEQPKSFEERLAQGVVVADGSIHSELIRRGFEEFPPDLYNLKNPVVVEEIHRLFVDAGAELVQTNTRYANRFALAAASLSDKVYEINRKAVWIARTIALHRAWVAGVVGPTGRKLAPVGNLKADTAHQAFVEQIVALIDGGADVLLFKSFIDIEELEIAVSAARFVNTSIPLIALKTFPEDGSVLATEYPREIADRLAAHKVICLGSNGTVGPQRMVSIMQAIGDIEVPLCALPDIGIPTIVKGRPVYHADPNYVSEVAVRLVEQGVRIIGADGGATYEHIKAIADAVRSVVPGSKKVVQKTKPTVNSDEPIPDTRSNFGKQLSQKFLWTVELDIPRGADIDGLIDSARYLRDHGFDAVNISDGARARLRMNPVAISHAIQRETSMECVTHIACRDRNMVALQSDMLAAHILGIRNILAVTGDPTHIGDFPLATSVYDIDSVGLIRSLSRMNGGRDLSGNALGARTQFTICCAVNPAAEDLDHEIERLVRKAAEGCEVAFSQPLFEYALLERFREKTAHLPIRFMLGVIPLRTLRHAEFLHYEVPGMTVPASIRERMRSAGTSTETASREGIEIAVEFLKQARPLVDGAYLMPPFKKYDMAVEIMRRIEDREPTPDR